MSYTLTSAREALAAALTTVDGINVRLRELKTPRPGDGWTIAGTLTPDGYGWANAEIGALVLLSTDPIRADEAYDSMAVAILQATKEVSGTYSVRIDPATVTVGDGTSWSGIAVAVSVEVTA